MLLFWRSSGLDILMTFHSHALRGVFWAYTVYRYGTALFMDFGYLETF
jgi:hypothetical protein